MVKYTDLRERPGTGAADQQGYGDQRAEKKEQSWVGQPSIAERVELRGDECGDSIVWQSRNRWNGVVCG